jgi:hypothetical protein
VSYHCQETVGPSDLGIPRFLCSTPLTAWLLIVDASGLRCSSKLNSRLLAHASDSNWTNSNCDTLSKPEPCFEGAAVSHQRWPGSCNGLVEKMSTLYILLAPCAVP